MAIKITAKHEPYYRCGVSHSVVGVVFADNVFTHRELEQLRFDPHLTLQFNYKPSGVEDVFDAWDRDRWLTREQRERLDAERADDVVRAASAAALTIENQQTASASDTNPLANAASSHPEEPKSAVDAVTEPKPAANAADEGKPTDAGNGAPTAQAAPGAKPAEEKAKAKSGDKSGQAAK